MRSKQPEPFNAWQHIGDLADRVGRLCPDRRDPERFHIEKSEIEHELRELARVLPGGGRVGVIRAPACHAMQKNIRG